MMPLPGRVCVPYLLSTLLLDAYHVPVPISNDPGVMFCGAHFLLCFALITGVSSSCELVSASYLSHIIATLLKCLRLKTLFHPLRVVPAEED